MRYATQLLSLAHFHSSNKERHYATLLLASYRACNASSRLHAVMSRIQWGGRSLPPAQRKTLLWFSACKV